jgi:hypothetical protein
MATAMTSAPMICRGLRPKLIHGQNGNHGEDQVDRADNDGLEQRGIGVNAHVLENFRRIIEHDVDADELLEDRQHDADENEQRAEGKQFAGVMFGQRGA